jgi:excisionase family DNA binding protein
MSGVAVPLPQEVIEAIAVRAAELVAERLEREASPWMTRAQAARYLGLPVSRLEKNAAKEGSDKIPLHRDGARVLYHRDELDHWLLDKA